MAGFIGRLIISALLLTVAVTHVLSAASCEASSYFFMGSDARILCATNVSSGECFLAIREDSGGLVDVYPRDSFNSSGGFSRSTSDGSVAFNIHVDPGKYSVNREYTATVSCSSALSNDYGAVSFTVEKMRPASDVIVPYVLFIQDNAVVIVGVGVLLAMFFVGVAFLFR